MATRTYIGYPVNYDEDNSTVNGVSNESNAFTDSSSTTYAQFTSVPGWNANTVIFFDFNCSSIPTAATITSVECSVKCQHTATWSSESFTATSIQLYNGTENEKGEASTYSASTTTYTLDTGTWSRAELNDIKLRIGATRGIKNMTNTYYIRVYGATLTVNYTYNEDDLISKMYIKNDGVWTPYNRVYKKINGVWIEQDISLIGDSSIKYIRKEI